MDKKSARTLSFSPLKPSEAEMLRLLTEKDVKIVLEREEEFLPIRGNCSAVDPITDAATEELILKQLKRGNDWAWCTVHISVEWKGFFGHSYLGCCSYKSEKDFVENSGYYADMVQEALSDLNCTIQGTYANLKTLEG